MEDISNIRLHLNFAINYIQYVYTHCIYSIFRLVWRSRRDIISLSNPAMIKNSLSSFSGRRIPDVNETKITSAYLNVRLHGWVSLFLALWLVWSLSRRRLQCSERVENKKKNALRNDWWSFCFSCAASFLSAADFYFSKVCLMKSLCFASFSKAWYIQSNFRSWS